MDSSSKTRTSTPQNAQRAQKPAHTNTSSTIGEIGGRVDQLALLQNTLLNGATPTMIAGFAMIIAQMQAQADYPEARLTITSSIEPLELSATLNDGAWHGYDLTHKLIDSRSHVSLESLPGLPWTRSGHVAFPKQPCNHQPSPPYLQ